MVRIENKGRSRWIFPVTGVVTAGKRKRRVETMRVVIGSAPGPGARKRKKADTKIAHIVELSDEDFEKLGKVNHDMIDELERIGELEVRRTAA